MTEPIDEAFLELQREYLSELPDRLEEIRADIGAFRAGSGEAAGSLKMRFLGLAGSGGSYGFPEISQIAREQEQWIATGPRSTDSGRLDEALEQLAAAHRRLLATLGGSPAEPTPELRACLILPSNAQQDQLAEALRLEGFQVCPAQRTENPATPGAGPLDLLVIGIAAGEGDPSALASIWTRWSSPRPRAVV